MIDYHADMPRTLDPDIKLLAALADPTRLSIVRQLAACDGVCACDFTDLRTVSQPTISHHLRVLREAGVVTTDRRGSSIWYRLSPDAIRRLGELARSLVPGDFVPVSELLRTPVKDSTAPSSRPS
jgi:DNA-binding transcriptional ArsR family regulator